MKSLNDKLTSATPNTNAYIGANFQAYILRERESYTKSIHEAQQDTPLIHSLTRMHNQRGANMYSPDVHAYRQQYHGASASSLH